MIKVPIFIIEDQDINDSLDLSKVKDDFKFYGHESLGTSVRDIIYEESDERDGVKVRGVDIFNKYADLLSGRGDEDWGSINGPAILIVDLGLKANLNFESDYSDPKKTWADKWTGDQQQKEGLYLIGEALQNENWYGVIYIATSLGIPLTEKGENMIKSLIEDFKGSIQASPEVEIGISRKAAHPPGHGNLVLDEAIKLFLEYFGDRIGNFLRKMSTLSQKDCHHGWDKNNPPVQFKHLASLLGMQPEELAELIGMSSNSYPGDSGHVVTECLKTLGTYNTGNFSPLGALFVAWAAHRVLFPEGPSDEEFGQVISELDGDLPSKKHEVVRGGSISAPRERGQESGSVPRNKVIRAFFEMMKALLKADQDGPGFDKGDDLLRGIKINEHGLRFHLSLPPEGLAERISEIADPVKASFDVESTEGGEIKAGAGGTTSKNILKFWVESGISESAKLGSNQIPFLGAQYPISICNASDANEGGTFVMFGNP